MTPSARKTLGRCTWFPDVPLLSAATLRVGNAPAARAYLGSALVWQAGTGLSKTGGAAARGVSSGSKAGIIAKTGGGVSAIAGGSGARTRTSVRTAGAVAIGAGSGTRPLLSGFGVDAFGAGLF